MPAPIALVWHPGSGDPRETRSTAPLVGTTHRRCHDGHPLIQRSLLNFVGLRRCRVAIASAAPIAPEILKFFRVLGVPIREAYGLTEASGASTMQTSDASPVGTVGVPYSGIEIRLADDGEIQIKGDVVFQGYYKTRKRLVRPSTPKAGCTPVTLPVGKGAQAHKSCASLIAKRT